MTSLPPQLGCDVPQRLWLARLDAIEDRQIQCILHIRDNTARVRSDVGPGVRLDVGRVVRAVGDWHSTSDPEGEMQR